MKKLPKHIFVKWDGEPPDQYLDARATSRGLEHGDVVGVYKFTELKTQKVTEELVPTKENQ